MLKILIVDDEEDLLTALSSLLKKRGFIVEALSNAHLVTDKINAFHPDVVMLDIHLGENLDGREIAREIKSIPQNSDIKIILSSAYEDESIAIEDFNADVFMGKPINFSDLVHEITLISAVNKAKPANEHL